MLLEPYSKPIRIRIQSGGVEHASLESLKCRFDINDACQVLDSFPLWFRQIGVADYAKQLDECLATTHSKEECLLSLIKILFSDIEQTSISKLEDIVIAWAAEPKYLWNKDNYLRNASLEQLKKLLNSTIRTEVSRYIFDKEKAEKQRKNSERGSRAGLSAEIRKLPLVFERCEYDNFIYKYDCAEDLKSVLTLCSDIIKAKNNGNSLVWFFVKNQYFSNGEWTTAAESAFGHILLATDIFEGHSRAVLAKIKNLLENEKKVSGSGYKFLRSYSQRTFASSHPLFGQPLSQGDYKAYCRRLALISKKMIEGWNQ